MSTASVAGQEILSTVDPIVIVEAFACNQDPNLQRVDSIIEQGQTARICVQAKEGVDLISINSLLFLQEKTGSRSTVKAQRAVIDGKAFSRHSHVTCQDANSCVIESKLLDKFFEESEETIFIKGETSVKADSMGQTRGGSVVTVPFSLALSIQR